MQYAPYLFLHRPETIGLGNLHGNGNSGAPGGSFETTGNQ